MWAQAVCEIIGYNVFNGAVASGGFQLSGAAAFLIDDLPPHARDFSRVRLHRKERLFFIAKKALPGGMRPET